MSEVKVLKLLDGLGPGEWTEFDIVIKSSQKPRLERLWDYVCGLEGDWNAYDKEEVFRVTFEKEYLKSEDYRLRNEMRLLRTQLVQFLTRKELLEALPQKPELHTTYLLKALLKRKLYPEFEYQFRNALAAAKEQQDHNLCFELVSMYFYHSIRHKEMKPELVQELWGLSREAMEIRQSISLRQEAMIGQWQAVLQAIARIYGQAEGLETSPVEVLPDGRARFMRAMAAATLAQGEARLTHAREALEHISGVEQYFPQNMVDAYAMCAGANFALRNYAAARKDYEAAIAYANSRKVEFRLDIRFNYCSTLMKIGAFRETIAQIESHKAEIDAHPRVSFRFRCLHSFAYIFLGEGSNARKLIPSNIRQRARSEYHYFRFILCILPYLQKDYEGGLREATNFIHYFNRNPDPSPLSREKEIANAFKHFYLALSDQRDRSWQREKLQGVRQRLEEFVQQNPIYQDYLYIRWLLERISENLQSG